MSIDRYDIVYVAQLKGWRFFTGSGTGSFRADRGIVLDALGRVIFPAALIKGTTRNMCENLIETLTGVPSTPHSGKGGSEYLAPEIAELFGKPGERDLRCRFTDLKSSSKRSSVMNRVRMDHLLNTARQGSLFDTEYGVIEPEEQLQGRVSVWLDSAGAGRHLSLIGLLCAGLKLVDTLGGETSTGSGSMGIEVDSINGRGHDIDLHEAIDVFLNDLMGVTA